MNWLKAPERQLLLLKIADTDLGAKFKNIEVGARFWIIPIPRMLFGNFLVKEVVAITDSLSTQSIGEVVFDILRRGDLSKMPQSIKDQLDLRKKEVKHLKVTGKAEPWSADRLKLILESFPQLESLDFQDGEAGQAELRHAVVTVMSAKARRLSIDLGQKLQQEAPNHGLHLRKVHWGKASDFAQSSVEAADSDFPSVDMVVSRSWRGGNLREGYTLPIDPKTIEKVKAQPILSWPLKD